MGDLGGGGHSDPVSLHFDIADEILDMAVLHDRCLIPAFHLGQPGFLNRLFIVALPDLRMLEDIVREFLMQQRRPVLHGFLHIQHERVFLVFHPDQPQRLRGRDLILRHDGRDVVPVEPDALCQDQAVRHILMGGVGGPGMARRRVIVLFFQVEAGQDLYDPGNLLRFGRVERDHLPVGNGGLTDPGDIGFFVAQVVRIFCPAGHLVKGVHSLYAFSCVHRQFPPLPFTVSARHPQIS